MEKVPDYLYTPVFLKFVDHFYKKFRANDGFGRWLHEYQQMEEQGLFTPNIIRALYVKMLTDKSHLGFIRGILIWYIGVYAQDATKAYFDNVNSYEYKICVVTGETATDDDGDEYIELSYDEASQICKALNEEAEEELFIIKKM